MVRKPILFPLVLIAFLPGLVYAKQVELACNVINTLYPNEEAATKNYIYDDEKQILVENWEIFLDGFVRGRANTFKTELSSPSLIVATYREPDGGMYRVRINRVNLEIQEIYTFPPKFKGVQQVFSKGICYVKQQEKSQF